MGIHGKKQPAPEAIAAILEGLGVKNVSIEDIVATQENTEEKKMLAEEGTLLTLANKPHKLVQRRCKQCEELFATDYLYVAYCSSPCRSNALKSYGLTHRNGTYGRSHEPITIPPDSLNSLRKLLAVEVSAGSVKVSQEVIPQCLGQLELPLFENYPTEPKNVERTLNRVHQKLGLAEAHKSIQSKEIDNLLAGLGV